MREQQPDVLIEYAEHPKQYFPGDDLLGHQFYEKAFNRAIDDQSLKPKMKKLRYNYICQDE